MSHITELKTKVNFKDQNLLLKAIAAAGGQVSEQSDTLIRIELPFKSKVSRLNATNGTMLFEKARDGFFHVRGDTYSVESETATWVNKVASSYQTYAVEAVLRKNRFTVAKENTAKGGVQFLARRY